MDGAHGGGGHGGGHGVEFGAPGGHGNEFGHSQSHGHAHGHDHLGGGSHGGREQHNGSLQMVFSHHNHSYHSRFSFNNGAHLGTSGGTPHSDESVDPIRDTVTLAEAFTRNCKPTRTYMTYVPNHAEFDHGRALQRYCRELSKRYFDSTSPMVVHGDGSVWGNSVAFAKRLLSRLRYDKKVLTRISKKMPGLNAVNVKKPKILSFHAGAEHPSPEDTPDGWLPGFSGSTHVIEDYFQLCRWSKQYHSYDVDRTTNTWLKVVMVVWKFDQTASYTTRFTVTVVSRDLFDTVQNEYGIVQEAFDEHQLAAQWLSKHMLTDLLNAKPDSIQMKLLKHYGALVQPPKHDTGVGLAPLDVVEELQYADYAEAGANDSDPRRTGDGLPGPSGIGLDPDPLPDGSGPDLGPPDLSGVPAEGDSGDSDPAAPMGIISSGADLDNILPMGVAPKFRKRPDTSGGKVYDPGKPAATTTVRVPRRKR